MHLLNFLAERWGVSLNEQFRKTLTFVNFQVAGQEEPDVRPSPPESGEGHAAGA